MENLVITNQGKELVAKMIEGTESATFTKVSASDHDYSNVNLQELTELTDVRQTVFVSSINRIDTALVEILAAMDNRELQEGYYSRAVGVFAEDGNGTEILFGVSIETENPFYLPKFGGKTTSSVTYRFNIKVDNSEQVEIKLNPGAYPTVEQFQSLQTAVSTHINSKVTDENGAHGFRCSGEELQINVNGAWKKVASSEERGDNGFDEAIAAHNANTASHPSILAKIEDIEDKLLALSIAGGTEITANSFAVTYGSLDGTVSNGIWNKTNSRLEF